MRFDTGLGQHPEDAPGGISPEFAGLPSVQAHAQAAAAAGRLKDGKGRRLAKRSVKDKSGINGARTGAGVFGEGGRMGSGAADDGPDRRRNLRACIAHVREIPVKKALKTARAGRVFRRRSRS